MAEFIPQPSCADPQEQNNLSVEQARAQISQLITPMNAWQKCALREALGQILHAPVISPLQVPPHNNSAMDGYAVRSADMQPDAFSLKQVGIAYAGQPYQGDINAGECVRIMTGAMMPPECDTVIMQEHVEVKDNLITVHGKQKAGQNVRMAGEDIQAGDAVLPAGHRITPADMGLIASLGIGEVIVKRRLRVAFFSTGDELRSIGEQLEPGQIYDSNRYTLYGMLKRLDVEVMDMGVVADEKAALKQALQQAAAEADVVITSGGVSVGDADYVKEMLAELGQVNFWKIAMKPGRPLAFGKIGTASFFGLPGNPVSVMVTFYQFVQPALKQMTGEKTHPVPLMQVKTESTIRKRPGRFEFQRGILFEDENGELRVRTTGQQGSGILRSMSVANCFILLDETSDGIEPGMTVTVQPFAGFV
ncbi:bifunctional molybdopterin-guanine dinucleotide biosynthesis adaptor protein MobB/molybdopterin molybdotransferase MoeA [Methylophaga sp. OBS4]|uniref:molybdopterin molybdotransferase MoeA n=1 Tax=Methylophaga sp. OBS4 TaxID=2991935 RepID=UPI0022594887|nr:bifunctional molybdopterin-guanine dinucleotide biosynthesis adaptor protein MobB/molybdopterin molybdotransferase MoeA [Methylophaga sp. OBS4]